jgi:hypothetical protein
MNNKIKKKESEAAIKILSKTGKSRTLMDSLLNSTRPLKEN